MVAARGFIDLNKEFTAVELKANPPVSDVSLLHPLIRKEIGVVFGIHNVVLISLDLSLDSILQVNGIVGQRFEVTARRIIQRRPRMFLEKSVPRLPVLPDPLDDLLV